MASDNPYHLPPPDEVAERISATEDELRALRQLLRASKAAARAEEARKRKLAATGTREPVHA